MDESLRRLERAWRASGQEEDHLRWVQARLRRGEREEDLPLPEQAVLLRARLADGELSADRLRVAAHCGCEEAAAALRIACPPDADDDRLSFLAWCADLEHLGGVDALPSAVAILAEIALSQLGGSFLDDEVPEALEAALEAWAEAPDPRRVAAIEDAYHYVDNLRYDVPQGSTESVALECLDALVHAAKALRWDSVWEAADRLGGPRVRSLLSIGLIPWALTPRQPAPDTARLRDYSPRARFRVGERIAHPRFGEGVVTRAIARQIEVEFAGARRKLAHGL